METLTQPSSEPSQREADLLARSLFTLLLVGALATIIVGILLLRAPMRPSVRTPLLIGYGIFFLAVLAGLGLTLAAPLKRIHAFSAAVARLFGRPALAAALALAIGIGVAVAVPVINGIVPNLASLAGLLVVWGALCIVVLAITNAGALSRSFAQARTAWALFGVALGISALVLLVFVGINTLLHNTRAIDRLRGSTDYRELIFYGNETNLERSQAYWIELGNLRNAWVSYVYTRMQAFTGSLINIDSIGRRVTASFVPEADHVPRVAFYGGSTMWGEGSRDAYTLPSQLARMLHADGTPITAVNYGQIAFVSTQELILFQRRLALGDVPDVAVFYDGFNDVASVYMHNGTAGLPHNEVNRQRDLLAGQILRDGRPLFYQPEVDFATLDFSLIATQDATPAQVVDLYLENLRLIRASAREYGVKLLFVWQPAIMYKQSLDPREQVFVDENRAAWPQYDELYQAVDEELRRRVRAEGLDDVLILSDLFADETRYLFYDRVHVIEDGNTLIAEAIKPSLAALLPSS